MKFEETVLTADGVVQLFFNIIIVKDMTILMLRNQGTNKNNQRKKKNTQAANTHTHKHRLKGKNRTQPINIPHTSRKTRFQETGHPRIVTL
jgi:protein required for attachment to host cells